MNGLVTATEGTSRVLLAGSASSIATLQHLVNGLGERVRGQVFVEVASAAEIVPFETPELITVAWLVRETRSGEPGTCETCRPGQALGRAVRAWVSEMSTGDLEVDGGELVVFIDGTEALVHELRLDMVDRIGSSTGSGTFVR
ncbi:SIP domain-containing protein [Subtercola sp. RTI3]|uniref:SIP domain-containing protein n=1 Tax=Subtercola sp. RTI3 TaxID=3048639 RepID=UPI002B231711|nr:SIP domain-containing protein [Subtercola sp. RTI3]MEA9985214.1 SIP domain-containing protein [Subtercola sp. RTI3]